MRALGYRSRVVLPVRKILVPLLAHKGGERGIVTSAQ